MIHRSSDILAGAATLAAFALLMEAWVAAVWRVARRRSALRDLTIGSIVGAAIFALPLVNAHASPWLLVVGGAVIGSAVVGVIFHRYVRAGAKEPPSTGVVWPARIGARDRLVLAGVAVLSATGIIWQADAGRWANPLRLAGLAAAAIATAYMAISGRAFGILQRWSRPTASSRGNAHSLGASD